jgi:DNA-binding XRE family transcriptional regulator
MPRPIHHTPLSHRLSAFRSSLDISREEAAARSGLDTRTWAAWELGEATPEAANWMKLPIGLGFDGLDAFWQAYCRFCCEHPELTSDGLQPSSAAGDVAQNPQGYQVAPGLHDMLAGMLRVDLENVFLLDWREQLIRQQAGLLQKVGVVIQEISDFLWIYGKARKKNK